MKRIVIGGPVLLSTGLALLLLLAPAAAAGDFSLEGSFDACGAKYKFGASGQAYAWRSGGC